MDSPTPSIQPGVDETKRHEALKSPTTPRNRISSMKSPLSRRDSTTSTTSQRSKTPRPAGHVIRDGQIGTLNPVETGKGLFATQPIAKHALLFAEEPLLFAPKGSGRVNNHKVRKFLEALDALPARRRADFMSLSFSPSQLQNVRGESTIQDRMRNWYSQVKGLSDAKLDEAVAEGMHALAIYRTNNVATMDDPARPDEVTGGVVYSVFSRINHACDANAAFFYLGVRPQRLGVRALRDIAAGEQVFVSYIGDKACRKMNLAQRQAGLASWGFECRCAACVKEEAKAEEATKKKTENEASK
ncbi:hypothetical protein PG993_002246 [Apiospora rasikravindrae]|uniref:SET domain-containing protein n=1 Tax=Apiospora rasikravindrae TaxID=990691 RepID=A0ABR1TW33_9PEZI